MLVQGQSKRTQSALIWVVLLGMVLLLGVLVATAGRTGGGAATASGARPAAEKVGKPAVSAPPPANAQTPTAGPLRMLQIAVADSDWQQIAAARQRAMARGMLQEQDQMPVPVSVTFAGETARGVARLKGDWLDHIDTDQWSLRFELQRPVGGMVRFSVQIGRAHV